MHSRAQTSLEYLLTYGWALILVATLVAVLVFIISSPAGTEASFSSSDPVKFLVKGGSSTSGELQLLNASGGRISIESVSFFGGMGASSSFSLNGETTFPVSVFGGTPIVFEGLAFDNDCGSGGMAVVFYTDAFGLKRSFEAKCNGGASLPITWYRFDEGSGGTTRDSSGNGNTGSLLPAAPDGPAWQSSCPSGKCLNFDGSNDNVDAGTTGTSLVPANRVATVSAWAYFEDRAQDRGNHMHLYGNHLYQHSSNNYFYFQGTNDYFNYVPAKDVWHHIAITYSGDSTTANIYFNGTQVAIHDEPAGSNDIPGFRIISRSSSAFDGPIDEVKVFDRVLTDFELCSLCNEHAASAGVTCSC